MPTICNSEWFEAGVPTVRGVDIEAGWAGQAADGLPGNVLVSGRLRELREPGLHLRHGCQYRRGSRSERQSHPKVKKNLIALDCQLIDAERFDCNQFVRRCAGRISCRSFSFIRIPSYIERSATLLSGRAYLNLIKYAFKPVMPTMCSD